MHVEPTAAIDPKTTRNALLVAVLFAVVLGVGVFMRVYLLPQETLASDEVFTMTYLYQPTFGETFRTARLADPNMTPVYFTLQYLWSRAVGLSVLQVRLLSLLFGLLTLPLIFLVGRRLANAWVGLGAMLLLGIQPMHVYYSLEIRNYGLLALLGVASMYLFIRALQDGERKWWIALFVVDAVFALTHLFAGLLFVAQACFLLCFFRHERRFVVTWLIAHAGAAVLVLLWIATMDFESMAGANSYMQLPGVREVLTLAYVFAGGPSVRLYYFPYFSLPLGAPFAALLLAAVGTLLLKLATNRARDGVATTSWRPVHSNALLLMWLLIPPLSMFILSHIYAPCFWPRYVIYSAMAVPLVFSFWIHSIRLLPLRIGVVAVLAALWMHALYVDLNARPIRDYWIPLMSYLRDMQPNDQAVLLPSYAGPFISGLEILDPFGEHVVLRKRSWSAEDCEEINRLHHEGVGLWFVAQLNAQEEAPKCLEEFGGLVETRDYERIELRSYHLPGAP